MLIKSLRPGSSGTSSQDCVLQRSGSSRQHPSRNWSFGIRPSSSNGGASTGRLHPKSATLPTSDDDVGGHGRASPAAEMATMDLPLRLSTRSSSRPDSYKIQQQTDSYQISPPPALHEQQFGLAHSDQPWIKVKALALILDRSILK